MNVPNLRFPEFKENWKITTLGECSSKLEYGLGASAIEYDGIHKYIRITDIDDATNQFNSSNLTSPSFFDDNYKVKQNDILFARTGASVGKTYHYDDSDGNLYYAGFLIAAHILKEINSKFVFYNTLSNNYKKWVKIMSARSGQPGINAEEYNNYKFNIPTKEEQDRIALLMEKIDSKIQTQIKIINYLRTQEKHIINNIFNDIESKLYTLTNIAEVYQPKTISSNEFNKDGKYPVFGANGQIGKYDYYNHENEQICISCRGASAGSVNLSQQKSWITGNSMVVNLDNYSNIVNKKFIYYQLKAIDFTKFISGSGQPQITRAALDNLKIKVPSLETQNLLAYTLDLVESKINLETSICELYQLQKAYLLKNMFI